MPFPFDTRYQGQAQAGVGPLARQMDPTGPARRESAAAATSAQFTVQQDAQARNRQVNADLLNVGAALTANTLAIIRDQNSLIRQIRERVPADAVSATAKKIADTPKPATDFAAGNFQASGSRFASITPKLTPLDDAFESFDFQFAPDELTENISQVWAEGHSLGRKNPLLMWIRGEAQTVEFEAMLHTPSERFPDANDMIEFVNRLRTDCQADLFYLGRPPLWQLTWGDLDFGTVAIESIGGIRYQNMQFQRQQATEDSRGFSSLEFRKLSDLRAYRDRSLEDGPVLHELPRSVRFQLKLKKFEEFHFRETDPNARERQTTYVAVKQNEEWEHIAKRVYGEASLGEVLRKRYPGVDTPVPGLIVPVQDKDQIIGTFLGAESIPLAKTSESMAVLRETFQQRARPVYSAILGA